MTRQERAIKVEKNVPMPPKGASMMGRKLPPSELPWEEMKIGDSIFLSYGNFGHTKMAATPPISLRYGVSRRYYEDGVRIWRVR